VNPDKVERSRTRVLTDLPNIGPVMAGHLESIGIHAPQDLAGRDPFELYQRFCAKTHARQDPCALDVLISVVRFMDGAPPRPWWAYTEERKRRYGPL
jgi:hypothetical protein